MRPIPARSRKDPRLEVRPSAVHRRGIFTTAPIPALIERCRGRFAPFINARIARIER